VHSGEINVPIAKKLFSEKNILATIPEIVAKKKTIRKSDKDVTVFCSTGLAIQDLATARMLYEKAMKAGIGTKIKLS